MSTIDKKSAVQILNSRIVIAMIGKYTAKVTSVSPFTREDGTPVMIVNFAAMTAYQLGQAKEAFGEGDYDKACNFNVSTSLLSGRYVPAKGEIVDIEVVERENKDGVTILVIDTIVPRQAIKAAKASFSFEEEAEVTDVTPAEMRKALIAAGELTEKKAKALSDADIAELYAVAQPELV